MFLRRTARRRHTGIGAWLAILAFPLAACSSSGPPASPHVFTVTEEDGVEVAMTTGGPKFEGELFEYTRVLEIRPDPDNPDSFLWGPQWMVVSDDGRIFVSDMPADQIVVFDAEGKYLRRIGTKGEGPGELRSLGSIDIFEGELWANDWLPSSSEVFDLDGRYLRTVTIPQNAQALTRNGRWWGLNDDRLAIFNLGYLEEGGLASARAEMFLIDAEGNVLADIETPWVPQMEFLDQGDGGPDVPLHFQFAAMPFGSFRRDRGFYVTAAVEPEVRVYDLDGNLERVIRIDLPARPVSAEDRARVQARLEDDLQRTLNPVDGSEVDTREALNARVRRDNPRFADPKPHWSELRVDDRGFVWLSDHTARDLPEGKTRWFVLSPEGEYLGQTVAPGWAEAQRGLFITREEDPESGEIMPVVFRIHSAVEGFEY